MYRCHAKVDRSTDQPNVLAWIQRPIENRQFGLIFLSMDLHRSQISINSLDLHRSRQIFREYSNCKQLDNSANYIDSKSCLATWQQFSNDFEAILAAIQQLFRSYLAAIWQLVSKHVEAIQQLFGNTSATI